MGITFTVYMLIPCKIAYAVSVRLGGDVQINMCVCVCVCVSMRWSVSKCRANVPRICITATTHGEWPSSRDVCGCINIYTYGNKHSRTQKYQKWDIRGDLDLIGEWLRLDVMVDIR